MEHREKLERERSEGKPEGRLKKLEKEIAGFEGQIEELDKKLHDYATDAYVGGEGADSGYRFRFPKPPSWFGPAAAAAAVAAAAAADPFNPRRLVFDG